MNADQAKGLLAFFLQSMENEFTTTRKVIAAIPQNQCEYKPDAKSKSARELAWHLAGADIFFMDAVINGQFDMTTQPPPAPAQISDILGWYDGATKDRLGKIKNLSGEALSKHMKAFGVFDLPAVAYLQFMLLHSAHHRGQLSTYLRPMGGKVPSIYGGSADEPFQMPA